MGNNCILCESDIPCAESAFLTCSECASKVPIEGYIFDELSQAKATIRNLEKERERMLELFDQTLTEDLSYSVISEDSVDAIKAFLASTPPTLDNPADDPNQCLACLGAPSQHTCTDYVVVRRKDLQQVGDASGWDCDEATYNRLKIALGER